MRDEAVCWMPETEQDRRRVEEELNAIISSKHFRNSKRYPALLRFLVEETLSGRSGRLKERTLGIEVFDRRPDYDTNADPVVRFSAAEVRKRIAQYYHEVEEAGEAGSDLHIELPLGAYAPEFRVKAVPYGTASRNDNVHGRTGIESTVLPSPEPIASPSTQPGRFFRGFFSLKAVVYLTVLLAIVSLICFRMLRPSAVDAMWSPVMSTAEPVLIVLGHGTIDQEPPQTTLYEHMMGPSNHISLSSSIALNRISNRLENRGKSYTVKIDTAASLADLRRHSVIAIGALNNEWALRLTDQLRFRFVQGPLARVEDIQNPQSRDWIVDFSQPFSAVKHDYAIVARFHDPLTNGTTVIIAGLGPYGTEAAGEFISSQQYLEQISSRVPGSWAAKNLEMVIRTDVVAGEPGPPTLVAVSVW